MYALSAAFEPAPGWCTLLTLGRLLGKAGGGAGGGDAPASGSGMAGGSGIAEVEMEEDGGTPSAAPAANGSSSGAAGGMGGSSEGEGEGEESPRAAARPGRSRWAAMDDSSEDEGASAAARKKKKLGGGGGGGGGLAVDDWRELLASGKQALAGKAPGSTPRGILSRGSGGSASGGNGRSSAGRKRVRWPDEVGRLACSTGACFGAALCAARVHCMGSWAAGTRHGLHPSAAPASPPCSAASPRCSHAVAGPPPPPRVQAPDAAAEEQGFRIGGGGERAKSGLEVRRRGCPCFPTSACASPCLLPWHVKLAASTLGCSCRSLAPNQP